MRTFIFCCSVLVSFGLYAQTDLGYGMLPQINISKKLPASMRITQRIESRLPLFQYREGWEASYQLTDFTTFLAKRRLNGHLMTAGYTLRVREGALTHRFIQQYAWVQEKSFWQLGYRVGLDQTVDPSGTWEHRLRYRVLAEVPLSGAKVDVGELYLKVGHEQLWAYALDAPWVIELRALAQMGVELRTNFRIEWGLDYRWNKVLTAEVSGRQRIWSTLAFFSNF